MGTTRAGSLAKLPDAIPDRGSLHHLPVGGCPVTSERCLASASMLHWTGGHAASLHGRQRTIPRTGPAPVPPEKDNPTVALTERAGELLERFQSERALPHALRIDFTPEEGELSMGMTDPCADDERLYHGENVVLYVSAPAAEALADCTVTTRQTPQGIALAVAPTTEVDQE